MFLFFKIQSQLCEKTPSISRRLLLGLLTLVFFFGHCFSGDSIAFVYSEDETTTEPETPEESEEDAEKRRISENEHPIEEYKLPSAAELLKGPALDRIILNNEKFVIVEPIPHRPNVLKKQDLLSKQLKKKLESRQVDDPKAIKSQIGQLKFVDFRLPDFIEEDDNFNVGIPRIVNVVHYEDLVIERIHLLLKDGDFRTAFDLLLYLTARLEKLQKTRDLADPDGLLPGVTPKDKKNKKRERWPGLFNVEFSIAYVEAQSLLKKDESELALVKLEDLFRRRPTFQGLDELSGKALDRLIMKAVKQNNFRKARHFLLREKRMFPKNEVALNWENRFNQSAADLIKKAQAFKLKNNPIAGVDQLQQAIRVWPRRKGLATLYSREANRYQVMNVAVLELGGNPVNPVLPTDADVRHLSLTRLPLFSVANIVDGSPGYKSVFFEEWEPTDLGRELTFKLRTDRQNWDAHPVITSDIIVSQLKKRLDLKSKSYDERLDYFVKSVRVLSPKKFVIALDRVPVRPETLLKTNIFPELREGESAKGSIASRSQRFQLVLSNAKERRYRRAIPEPDKQDGSYHVMEVREKLFPNVKKAIQAVNRQEIHCLPYIPLKGLERLQKDPKYFVVQYAQPRTHVLQFNPESSLFKLKQMRRAMQLAIDRKTILEDVFLDDIGSDRQKRKSGRLITAPFASSNSGYNRLVPHIKYSPITGRALLLAVFRPKKEGAPPSKRLTEPPPIRLLVPNDPRIQEVAQKLKDSWTIVGLKTTLVKWSDGIRDPKSWDVVYRAIRMKDPQSELWPFLTMNRDTRVKDLDSLPQWLRVELMKMDSAGDWTAANSSVQKIHAYLASQTMTIPLWEIEEYMLFRRNVSDFSVRPIHAYDGVDQWVVEPIPGELRP